MRRPTLQWSLLLWLALSPLAGGLASAQETASKKPLTIEDYDRWRTVISTAISDDGRWMTYAYGHREGEDTLMVQDLDGDRASTSVPQGERPVFSDDARWVAYRLSDAVELLDLRSGSRRSWKGVGEFRFAEGSGHLALRKTVADSDAAHSGSDLILLDLSTGSEMLLGSIASFAFNSGGGLLGYTVDAHGQAGNGIYLVHLGVNSIEALDNGELRYDRLTWDRSGSALAGLKGTTPEGFTERVNTLVAFRNLGVGEVERFAFDPAQAGGVPEGMVISEKGALRWRDDGSMVFVGIDEQRAVVEDDPDNPRPNVDVFHWKDDRIQSVQRAQAGRDRQFTFLSAVSLASGRFVTLADSAMRTVTLSRDGRLGVGRDDRAYISDWKESQADYYLLDPETGERRLMLEGQKRTLGLSPDGRYLRLLEGRSGLGPGSGTRDRPQPHGFGPGEFRQ